MAPLERLRRQHLLSQRELAKRAGVALSTVYLIEAGKTRPQLKVMRAICEVLNVTPFEVDEFRAVVGGPSQGELAA